MKLKNLNEALDKLLGNDFKEELDIKKELDEEVLINLFDDDSLKDTIYAIYDGCFDYEDADSSDPRVVKIEDILIKNGADRDSENMFDGLSHDQLLNAFYDIQDYNDEYISKRGRSLNIKADEIFDKHTFEESLDIDLNEALSDSDEDLFIKKAQEAKKEVKKSDIFAICFAVRHNKKLNINKNSYIFIAKDYDDYKDKADRYCNGENQSNFQFYSVYNN